MHEGSREEPGYCFLPVNTSVFEELKTLHRRGQQESNGKMEAMGSGFMVVGTRVLEIYSILPGVQRAPIVFKILA